MLIAVLLYYDSSSTTYARIYLDTKTYKKLCQNNNNNIFIKDYNRRIDMSSSNSDYDSPNSKLGNMLEN